MGIEPGRDSDHLNRAFIDAVDASIALLRLPILPSSYRRGLHGRALLVEHFGRQLETRRRNPGPDLFSRLCEARSEDGERFTEDEIVNHITFVMMAAHDTSTSTLSTVLFHLAKNPEWQERLRAQRLRLPEQLSLDELEQVDELGWAIDEALRLSPPLAVMPRQTSNATEHGGYLIPAGVLIGLAPLIVHRDPRHWSRPHEFDPERFWPTRAEHKSHPFAFAPFGGGRHLCIGKRFGYLEIRSTLHQMLRRIRWSVPDGYQLPFKFVPIIKPADGLPLTLRPIG
jgi:cytochrome P450